MRAASRPLGSRGAAPALQPSEAGSGVAAATGPGLDRLAVRRCGPLFDALWLLAWLTFDDRDAAEQAVVDAVAGATSNPASVAPGVALLWSGLAEGIESKRAAAATGSTLTGSGLTRPQREAVALVASGRAPSDAAVMLGVPVGSIHRHLRAGLTALRAKQGASGDDQSDVAEPSPMLPRRG